MHKHMLKWLLLAVFFLLFLPLSGQAQAVAKETLWLKEPSLRVGILTGQPSVHITADSKFNLVSAGTNKILGSFRAYEKVTVTVKDNGMAINGTPVAATGIHVVRKNNDVMVFIEQFTHVNNRRYRGEISIHRAAGKSGLTVVNTLPVEEYLYGIIKNEISPDWAMEAVKAQAVAARTYALASNKKHKADGFDVCATTDCQVYGGRESETPRAKEAVDATRGLVLLHNNKLITAYFHSSSGGHTENSENVWSSPEPYLKGVADFDQDCPYFKWEKKLTIAELNQAISKAGFTIGRLQAIELSPLDKPVNNDRGVSGRVKNLRLIGTNGSVEISGTKMRNMLELKSTLFDITTTGNDRAKSDQPVFAGKKNLPPQTQNTIRSITGQPSDVVIIYGFGWGHGLGLSQWGAKAMAEKAPPGNTEYFKDILKHYYQGVEIKKAYI